MARHRSPQGRRAHLGLPLPLTPAAAGAGGATITLPARPTRLIAWAVAGSALAAAGQMAVTEALPVAADGVNVLRVGVTGLFSPETAAAEATAATTPLVAAPLAAVTPVAAAPAVVGAGDLVKASDLYAAAAAEAARAAEEARLAEEARAVEEARLAAEATTATTTTATTATATTAVAASGGGVQMVVGRLTSGFGARWGTSHQGLDIAAPIGTPIRVPLDGTVIDSGPASGFGQWVRVRHDDGTVTVYGHISESHVSVGDSVSAGDVIAEVGNEGRSTGPHLHFEVVVDGTKVNPQPWLDERGVGLT